MMGQYEVYEILKSQPNKWLTTKEISEGMNSSRLAVAESLRKLRKSGEIESRRIDCIGRPYQYKFKES